MTLNLYDELRELAGRLNREKMYWGGLVANLAACEVERLRADLDTANQELEQLRREKREEIVRGFSR